LSEHDKSCILSNKIDGKKEKKRKEKKRKEKKRKEKKRKKKKKQAKYDFVNLILGLNIRHYYIYHVILIKIETNQSSFPKWYSDYHFGIHFNILLH